jgi:bifunctional ADP-heptose synthase (sugar kinase/adenylyltransferase)
VWHPEKLDTREKIVALEVALARTRGASTAVVTGYFDPLLAAHARRLAHIRAGRDRLIVLLSDPPHPVLDAASRAQLLAALDVIDYVVLPQECASSVESDPIGRIVVYREEAADEARFERLVEHVRRRHQPVVYP